jgi:hypothetical protein
VARFTDVAEYLRDNLPHLHALNMQMMAAVGRVEADGNQRIDIVITSYDRGLLHSWWSGGQWHMGSRGLKWEEGGGEFASRASLVSMRDGRLDAFALGLRGDLMHAAYEHGNWEIRSVGLPEGDRLASHPTAFFDASIPTSPRLWVFVRGIKSLWVASIDTVTGRSMWTWIRTKRLGLPRPRHRRIFAPACTSWGPGRVDLFEVRSRSRQLVHVWKDGGTVGEWEIPFPQSLGITSSPDAVTWRGGAKPPVIYLIECGPSSLAGGSFAFQKWDGKWIDRGTVIVSQAVSDAALASWGRPRLDFFYVATRGDWLKGPFVPAHAWREGGSWPSTGARGWNFDRTDFGAYPVEWFTLAPT